MSKCCLIYSCFFNIYICTKRYYGLHKYSQVNFFSNVVKYVRPTYGNKEELTPLNGVLMVTVVFVTEKTMYHEYAEILRIDSKHELVCSIPLKNRYTTARPIPKKGWILYSYCKEIAGNFSTINYSFLIYDLVFDIFE